MSMDLSQLIDKSGHFAGHQSTREQLQYSPDLGFTDANNSSLAKPAQDSFTNIWRYSGESGEVTLVQTELRPGFSVWFSNCLFKRLITWSMLDHPSALLFCINLSGHATFRYPTVDQNLAVQSGHHGIVYVPGGKGLSHVQPGIPFSQIGITIEPYQLMRIFNGETISLLPFFRPTLDSRPDGNLLQMGIATPEIVTTARQILNCRQHGLARKLFLEGKALELISYQLECLANQDAGRQRSPAIHPDDLRQTQYAHDILVSDIEQPPNLRELAKAVGMSHPKLSRCFKRVFGSTVFEYLRNERLFRAKDMLEHQGVTVTEAAYAVGYSSPSHFSQAYKKHFGKSPGDSSEETFTS